MINLHGLQLNTTIENVLANLKQDLLNKDINRFATTKETYTNIQTNCPFHKDGQEKKPSFGIRKEDGKCHCLACNYSADLDEMISNIYGYNDLGKYGRNWLIKNFVTAQIETRARIIIPNRNEKPQKQEIQYVSEQELDTYRYTHKYMYERGLTNEIIEMFDVGYDKNTNCLTFPVCDENGNCLFIARRSVKTKFFNYPNNVDKPLYGLHHAKNHKKIWVTESILNCLTCWKYNIPAIALNGLGSITQINTLKTLLSVRHIVLALDPDKRGIEATRRLRTHLKEHKLITEIQYTNDKQDLNDLQEKILQLKEIR